MIGLLLSLMFYTDKLYLSSFFIFLYSKLESWVYIASKSLSIGITLNLTFDSKVRLEMVLDALRIQIASKISKAAGKLQTYWVKSLPMKGH